MVKSQWVESRKQRVEDHKAKGRRTDTQVFANMVRDYNHAVVALMALAFEHQLQQWQKLRQNL